MESSLNIELNYSMVLIKMPFVNPRTKGGIIKTENQIEIEKTKTSTAPQRLLVVAPDVDKYKVNDFVYFHPQCQPIIIPIDDRVYNVYSVSDIIGKAIYTEPHELNEKEGFEAKPKLSLVK